MARLIPVEDRKTGRIVWTHDCPDICPAGHADGTLPEWRCCPTCGRRDTVFLCRQEGCGAYSVDWDHDCNGKRITGKGFARGTPPPAVDVLRSPWRGIPT